MEHLKAYLETDPKRSKTAWAEQIGISRPYLIDLVTGRREPSRKMAKRIAASTGGKVPVDAW